MSACVDTAPVFEREHAQRAGIGAMGKHTLLIDRGIGSYFFLGEILSTRHFAPTPEADPDPCGTCTRCIEACPTDAIVFGLVSDPNSAVSRHYESLRTYSVLNDLGTRPRTRYLARIENENEEIPS